MSNISIDTWNDFMNKVGENFYDFIHGENEDNTQYTMVGYPYTVEYEGIYKVAPVYGNYKNVPVIGHFKLESDNPNVFTSSVLCSNSNLTTFTYNSNDTYPESIDISLYCPHSYFYNHNNFWVGSDNFVYLKNASGVWQNSIFKWSFNSYIHNSDGTSSYIENTKLASQIKLQSGSCSVAYGANGYDYYIIDYNTIPTFYEDYSGKWASNGYAPSIIKDSPFIFNSNNINLSSQYYNDVKNIYVNSGDTITNYTYNIDNNNYIDVHYSADGNGVPTGFIDINPTGQISFDDLFDMFNTILAPLVGVGLDLPDWNDYLPPVVTGDINVNIDLPDVTGVYPAETITPIDSDVYNIMSIDSMPQLPSLTGIDNGQAGAALGSSFTFLDGCGLLMPFITIAIIRLLISKFRGDS